MLAYPNVKVGSSIYIKYKMTVHEPPVEGFYSNTISYADDLSIASEIEFTSEEPLHYQINDPRKDLRIKTEKRGKKYLLKVSQKRPMHYRVIEESYRYSDPKLFPIFSVSSSKEWTDMSAPVLEKYEKVLSAKMPKFFKKIIKKVKKNKSDVELINQVTSKLAASMSYLGDWRPVQGGYVPRSLAQIAKTKLGDCKDFSASTAVMLRELGFKANIAWVMRSTRRRNSPITLPRISFFNHAIVFAEKDGKSYWIDPTNFSSYAQGVFPDIANRPALVVKAGESGLRQIPPLLASQNVDSIQKLFSFVSEDKVETKGSLTLTGVLASYMAGLSLKASKKTIDYQLMSSIGKMNYMSWWKVEDYKLDSRIVSDLNFKYSYAEIDSQDKTTAGNGFYLPKIGPISKLLVKTKDRISDLYLGIPRTSKRKFILQNIEKVGSIPLDCEVSSDWFNAKRTVTSEGGNITLNDEFVTKKMIIPNKVLKSKGFQKLKKEISRCFNHVTLIYQKSNQGRGLSSSH